MIAARRLTAQRIARPTDAKPADVVAALGAVQAQDYAAAKWAIGLRLASATSDAAVERAIDEGALVRTHAFRGTWQLIARGDVRWMLALVAPRLIASNATPYRTFGLDAATIRKSQRALRPVPPSDRTPPATSRAPSRRRWRGTPRPDRAGWSPEDWR